MVIKTTPKATAITIMAKVMITVINDKNDTNNNNNNINDEKCLQWSCSSMTGKIIPPAIRLLVSILNKFRKRNKLNPVPNIKV